MSTRLSARLTPVVMRMPRPPPSTKVASVAVPTRSTRAVRMPASMIGTARGSSIWNNTWTALMPMPRPASTSLGSTASKPTMVFFSTGRKA